MPDNYDIKITSRADTSGLDKAEAELRDVDRAAEDAAKAGVGLGEVFSGTALGGLAAGIISEAAGGLRQMAFDAINLADNLADLSAKAGTSASALQRIGNAAADNGSSIEGAADGIAKLTVNAEKALAGNDRLAESFKRLGIPLQDIKSLSPDELFLRIADSVSTTNDRGRAFADVSELMGSGAKDLFATLSLGSEDIKKLGDSFGVFSDETVQRLDEAKQSLDKFKQSLTILAGEAVSFSGEFLSSLGNNDQVTRWFSRLYGLSEEQIKAFDAMDQKAQATGKNTADAMRTAAAGAEDLGASLEDATKKIALLDKAFEKRSLDKLPIEKQAEVIRQKIEDLRGEIGKELPGIKFGDAEDLNVIANGLGDNALKAKELAAELAGLEDALLKTEDATAKAAAGEVKSFDKVTSAIARQKQALDDLDALKKNLAEARSQFVDVTTETLGGVQSTQTFRKEDTEQTIGGNVQAKAGATPVAAADVQALNQLEATVTEKERAVAEAAQSLQSAISESAPAMQAALEASGAKLNELPGHVEGFKAAVDEAAGKTTEASTKANDSLTKYGEAVTKGFADVDTFAATTAGAIGELTRRLAIAEQQIANLR